jgi:hypothetical protein
MTHRFQVCQPPLSLRHILTTSNWYKGLIGEKNVTLEHCTVAVALFIKQDESLFEEKKRKNRRKKGRIAISCIGLWNNNSAFV